MNEIKEKNDNKTEFKHNNLDALFLKSGGVIKTFRNGPYIRNEILYNHIYYESKISINKLAKLIGVNRQYVWGVLNRRLKVSFGTARKICDALGVKEIHTLFRQDDVYYPGFKTADEVDIPSNSDLSSQKVKGESN